MRFLEENTYELGQGTFQLFWAGIAQIPVIGNTEKRASTDALLFTSVVAFLQKSIRPTSENILGE